MLPDIAGCTTYGLKGSLNEYELDLLRQRSLSARYEKARRGELVVGAPVGFRNGASPVKHGFQQTTVLTGFLGHELQCPLRGGYPRAWFTISRRPSRLRFGVGRFERLRALRGDDPGCVCRQALASVRGQRRAAANFMPGPRRFPSADLVRVLERDETVRRTRHNTCIIGSRVPARGHRWIATFRRGSFLLSLLIAGGMQPRLCRLERHRLLAREAELGAVPPHPVKYHADAPGQGNGRTLFATELRQT